MRFGPVRPSEHAGTQPRPATERPAPQSSGAKRSHDEAFPPSHEQTPHEQTPHEQTPHDRPAREQTSHEEQPGSGRKRPHDDGGRTEDGAPPAKRQRTPSYENTEAVLRDRGLEPPTREQFEALQEHLAGTGEGKFPKPTPELLEAVNPHKGAVDGDNLHSCLESTEALRDTHYGRPRPAGQPFHGRPEESPAWTLLKRHDAPFQHGVDQHGVDSLLEQVHEAGPGTFSTVLFGKPGEEGHALALIHGQDGKMVWADPSTHKTWEAEPGKLPGEWAEGNHVWASTSGPHEETIHGEFDHGLFESDAAKFGVLSVHVAGETLPPHDKQMVEQIATQIDQKVQVAAGIALADPASVPALDGYTRNWVNNYNEWVNPATTPERRAELEGWFPAQFGYAVESMTTKLISADIAPHLPPDVRVETQVTHGSTRPDLVITRTDPVTGVKTELGWIDITAEASAGHILDKQSSLWNTRPYVAETLYPSLDRTQLGSGGSPEARRMVEAINAEHVRQQQARQELMNQIQQEVQPPQGSSKKDRKTNIEQQLGTYFGQNRKLTPTEARNVLKALQDTYGGDYAPAKYGYGAGDKASYAEGYRLIEKFRTQGATEPEPEPEPSQATQEGSSDMDVDMSL